MKVKILRSVRVDGLGDFERGDEADVPKSVAERWVVYGYAEAVKAKPKPKEQEED